MNSSVASTVQLLNPSFAFSEKIVSTACSYLAFVSVFYHTRNPCNSNDIHEPPYLGLQRRLTEENGHTSNKSLKF